MYQASEMNLVTQAEKAVQEAVTQPRHVRVYLHRSGAAMLMGYTGDEYDVFFLALTKYEDAAQNEILLRAMRNDPFDLQITFREALHIAGIDWRDWFVFGEDFRGLEEYEPAEGAKQLSEAAQILRVQAHHLSAGGSCAKLMEQLAADCRDAEQLRDAQKMQRTIAAMRRIADDAQCLVLQEDEDIIQHYRKFLRAIDLLMSAWRRLTIYGE